MSGLYVERHMVDGPDGVAPDIARHLYVRRFHGSVVVVTDTPKATLALVRKEWHQALEQRQVERFRRLYPGGNRDLVRPLESVQQPRFLDTAPATPTEGDVYFTTAKRLLQAPLECQTLYVAAAIDQQALDAVASSMPAHGLIVLY